MNGSIWQLTKRRWAVMATEPGVYVAFAITVIGFAALGPFGTFSEMPVTERIGFWFLVHLMSWVMAILLIVPTRFTLEHFGVPVLPAFVTGSFCANIAIAPIFIWILAYNTNADVTASVSIGLFIVVAFVITLITYLVLRFCGVELIPSNWKRHREILNETERAMASANNDAGPGHVECAMMQKLPAERRGELFAMVAHDHYVEVVTDRGRHLVLMRLSDAAELCGPCDGMRVHRSAWVARAGISELIVKGRRMWICLPDGSMITVSRQHQDAVRDFLAERPLNLDQSEANPSSTQFKPQ